MKQIEKFAENSAEIYLDKYVPGSAYDDHELFDSHLIGYKKGFQKALDCVTIYLKYKHRFGTINEFDINFEDIQKIADTEIEDEEWIKNSP